jgi:dimethylhistidine N-methyltransferase
MNSVSVLEIVSSQEAERAQPEVSAVARAVRTGLSARQKYLPSWLFYDAAGSRLFESITELPEYYLTGMEHSIFLQHADRMICSARGPECESLSVLELGAGSASKTVVLLRALMARQGHVKYMPVDVSEAALEAAVHNVRAGVPNIQVQAILSEFTHEKSLHLSDRDRKLALYIGSSIGNFDRADAVELLRWLRAQLKHGDALLLGTDMVKPISPMLAAYNDAAGVTAEFNKNILLRINRELGANFDVHAFEHRAIWNAAKSRIEMHLDSTREQTVGVPALKRSFDFCCGESIHTENSYKFTLGGVEDILRRSGFVLEQSWYDNSRWFGVHLARVLETETMPDDEAEDEAA